jgi:hypothetical protein
MFCGKKQLAENFVLQELYGHFCVHSTYKDLLVIIKSAATELHTIIINMKVPLILVFHFAQSRTFSGILQTNLKFVLDIIILFLQYIFDASSIYLCHYLSIICTQV